MKTTNKIHYKHYFEITLGVVIMVIGFYFFFVPMNLNTGGVTGLALVLNKLIDQSWFKMSYVVYALNIVLLVIAYFALGKKTFKKTIYPTILYPSLVFILEITKTPSDFIFRNFSSSASITSKVILATIFGSLLVGFGLGLVFSNSSSTGGMDIVQRILHKYLRVPYSIAIYGTDGLIVLFGLLVFNVEQILYAIISVFIIGLVVDKIIFAGKLGFTAFIVTSPEHEDKVKNAIINDLSRGFTKAKVTGGYTDAARSLIICTITKGQTFDLKDAVLTQDPNAFTFIVETREVVGYGFEQRG